MSPNTGRVSDRRPEYGQRGRRFVVAIRARAIHPLVSGHRRAAHRARRHGPADQVPGAVLDGGQRVPGDRRRHRVLLHCRWRRPAEPDRPRRPGPGAGVAGHPVVAVRRQYSVLAGGHRNGKRRPCGCNVNRRLSTRGRPEV